MVRWFALLLFLIAPFASAQVDLLADGDGDHGLPAGKDQYDLRSLSGAVEGDELVVTLAVGGFPGPEAVVAADNAYYFLHFAHGEAQYLLRLDYRVYLNPAVGMEVGFRASLDRWDDTVGWRVLMNEVPIEGGPASTLTARVPLSALADERDLPLRPGRDLTDFWVFSTSEPDSILGVATEDRPTPNDRMPDAGLGDTDLPYPVAEGDRLLAFLTDDAVRTSNGGPTVLVYNVTVHNEDTTAQDVPLRLEGLPETWTAHVLPDALHLEPGEGQAVLVVVQAQGAHSHGGDEVFRLASEGAGIDLAVHYPEVSQPAGHHDTLWFHSAPEYPLPGVFAPVSETQNDATEAGGFPTYMLWMNTLEDDPADMGGVEVMSGHGEPRWMGWHLPLAPRLGMGLVVTDDVGELVLPLGTTYDAPLDGVTLEAVLRHGLADGTGVRDLAAAPLTSVSFDGSVQEVRMPLSAAEAGRGATTVPYDPDGRLWLEVRVVDAGAVQDSALGMVQPVLHPGGSVRLPLGEYADPLPPALLEMLQAEGLADEDGTLQPAPDVAEPDGKDSPGLAAPLLGAGLLAVAVARRRCT